MGTARVIGSYANVIFVASGETLQVYATQYDSITVDGTLEKLTGDLSSGASTFLDLSDTPSSYSGAADKVVKVTAGEDGLEFAVVSTGTGAKNQVTFWDLNNQIKAITGITYDADLDALSLIGTTIYGDYGESYLSRGYLDLRRSSDTYNPFVTFWRKRETGDAVQSGDLLGRISAYGHDGTDWSSGSRVRINLKASQNWDSDSHGTKLDIEVTPNDSTSPVTAVSIDENGLKNERTNTVRTKDYTLTVPATGTVVEGSGTATKIPKFSDANTLTDSSITDGTNLTFSKNVDFATYKAIAMACDNGSTLSTSPSTGQWFLHTPPGRKVLMMYNGSSWTPIISLGSMTVYVDGTNGTDNQNYGYGTGSSAFKTVQYAIDQIPGQYGGNVTINIASGTYNELVTIRGKYPTGNYAITIYGAESTSNYSISTSTAGSNEVWGTITVSGAGWTTNEHVGKFVYHSSVGYRPIVSNTTDTITIVGVFPSAPTGSFTLMSLQTQIYGFVIACDNIYLYSIKMTSSSSHCIYLQNANNICLYNCYLLANSTYSTRLENSSGNIEKSYIYLSGNSMDVFLNGQSRLTVKNCIVQQLSGTKQGSGFEVSYSSYLSFGYAANLIDNFNYGIKIGTLSSGFLYITTSSNGKPIISNNTYGLYVLSGGQANYTSTTYHYYTGNTTDRYADSSSYGYYS